MSEVKQIRAWHYSSGDKHILTVSYNVARLTSELLNALDARVQQMVPVGYRIMKGVDSGSTEIEADGGQLQITFVRHVCRETSTGLKAGCFSEAGFTMDPMQIAH